MRRLAFMLIAGLVACTTPSLSVVSADKWMPSSEGLKSRAAAFRDVSDAVGAAASAECRRRSGPKNCNFGILVDLDRNAPANAFQTVDDSGQPVIIFTQSMILSAQNADELAFVMGHEAAHHILGHIGRQTENAKQSAQIFGELAREQGENAKGIERAQELGAEVGVQVYSRDFELEADRLGTVITHSAGYNPLIGIEFFQRIPDPGDRFLASHPPNARRVQAARETAVKLGISQ